MTKDYETLLAIKWTHRLARRLERRYNLTWWRCCQIAAAPAVQIAQGLCSAH